MDPVGFQLFGPKPVHIKAVISQCLWKAAQNGGIEFPRDRIALFLIVIC